MFEKQKDKKMEIIQWVFSIGVSVLFISLSIWAYVHFLVPVTIPPHGYLVPSPASIPAGLTQVRELYPACSRDSYTLEFSYRKNGQSILIISENPENEDWNYKKIINNYDSSIRLIKQHRKSIVFEKLEEIDRMGAHGTLFHQVSYGVSSYDFIMQDGARVIRIQANDFGPFHFSEDMVTHVINNLVRQDSESSTLCPGL